MSLIGLENFKKFSLFKQENVSIIGAKFEKKERQK